MNALPQIRYASDMPFAVGMVLADEQGRTVEITAVGTHIAVTGFGTGLVHQVIRQVYPYLVFVTELVGAAEAIEAEWAENDWPTDSLDYDSMDAEWAAWEAMPEDDEVEQVEALATRAELLDNLQIEIELRAATEHRRKNPA